MDSNLNEKTPPPVAYTLNFDNESKNVRNERIQWLIDRHIARSSSGQVLHKTRYSDCHKLSDLTKNLQCFENNELKSNTKQKTKLIGLRNSSSSSDVLKKTKNRSRNLYLDLSQRSQQDSASDIDLISFDSPECEKTLRVSSPLLLLTNEEQSKSLLDQSIEADLDIVHKSDDDESIKSNKTYIIDSSKYTDEQKARLSIDDYFKIQKIPPMSANEKTQRYLNNYMTFSANNEKHQLVNKFNDITISDSIKEKVNKQLFLDKNQAASTKLSDQPVDDDDDSMLQVAFTVPLNEIAKKSSKVVVNVSQKAPNKIKSPILANTRADLSSPIKNCFHAEISLSGGGNKSRINSAKTLIKTKDCNCTNAPPNDTQSILKQTQQFISSLQAQYLNKNKSNYKQEAVNATNEELRTSSHYLKKNSNICVNNNKNRTILTANTKTSLLPVIRKTENVNKNQKLNELSRSSSYSCKVVSGNDNGGSQLVNAKNRSMSHNRQFNSQQIALQKSASARILISSASSSSSINEDISDKKFAATNAQLTNTRYNRAFALRRGRLEIDEKAPSLTNAAKNRQLKSIKKPEFQVPTTTYRPSSPKSVFIRFNEGRNLSNRRLVKKQPTKDKKTLDRERELENWKRRKSYNPLKAASEGRKMELLKKQQHSNLMMRSCQDSVNDDEYDDNDNEEIKGNIGNRNIIDNLRRSQSFNETSQAMNREYLISTDIESDEDENGDCDGTIVLD